MAAQRYGGWYFEHAQLGWCDDPPVDVAGGSTIAPKAVARRGVIAELERYGGCVEGRVWEGCSDGKKDASLSLRVYAEETRFVVVDSVRISY